MGRVTARRRASHVTPDDSVARPETLVVEEPLEIRVDGRPVTVTMRTPGSDVELAQGFLLTEGVIGHRDDLLTVRYCEGTGPDNSNTYNVLDAALSPGVPMPQVDLTRNFYIDSLVRGVRQGTLDAVQTTAAARQPTTPPGPRRDTLPRCPSSCAPSRGIREHRRTARAPRCSTPKATCSSCARTSAGTTPSTKWSGGRSSRTGCR